MAAGVSPDICFRRHRPSLLNEIPFVSLATVLSDMASSLKTSFRRVLKKEDDGLSPVCIF
jgi:hypothetical protein